MSNKKKKFAEMPEADMKTKIDSVLLLGEQLKEAVNQESELYKRAMENRDRDMKIERKGKEIEVKEGDMWEEIRTRPNGLYTDAAEALKEIYPSLIQAARDREEKAIQIDDYLLQHFGFSFRHMSPIDMITLVLSLIDYKLDERLGENKDEKKNE